MDKKTQQILLFAGVGILAYMWWKKRNGSSFDAYNYAVGGEKKAAPFRCPCECKGQLMGVAEKCCGEGNREICSNGQN